MTSNASVEPFPPPTLDAAASNSNSKPSTSLVAALKPAAAAAAGAPDSSRAPNPQSPLRSADDIFSPKSKQAVVETPGRSPVALTGAAAMAEARQKRKLQPPAQDARQSQSPSTSNNPAAQAVQSLMGSTAISRPSDAPQSEQLSEPLQKVAEKIHIPDHNQADNNSSQASPVSMASFGTTESLAAGASAMTATATNGSSNGPMQFTAEPAQMTDADRQENGNNNNNLAAPAIDGVGGNGGGGGPKAYSYPGGPPSRQNSESTAGKRHKCPYCDTDFTRHHNLKSHMLTHSQEKPYTCQDCLKRFRRLHDLKRHSKLHTGERPHSCDKCGRRFARGDALARHNKGPGGCAGRRSSFGGGDDDFGPDGVDGDGMDGVEYTGEDAGEGSSPEQGRRESEPNRKRAHLETPHDSDRQVYRQQSSTYPPIYAPPPQTRGGGGGSGMGPPQVVLQGQQGSNQVSSPREMNNYPSPAAASSMSSAYYNQPPSSTNVFQQPGPMTESPRPLSPGQAPDAHRLSVGGDVSMSSATHRNRSPSLTTQFQQAHFGRGSVGGGGRTPPTQHPPPQQSQAPVLPPLSSSLQSTSSSTLSGPTTGSSGPGPNLLNQPLPPPGGSSSNPSSLSSHGQQSSLGSLRELPLGGAGTGGSSQQQQQQYQHQTEELSAHIHRLETTLSRMRDEYENKISGLQNEVLSLRGQIAQQPASAGTSGSSSGGGGGGAVAVSTAGTGTYSSEIPQPRY